MKTIYWNLRSQFRLTPRLQLAPVRRLLLMGGLLAFSLVTGVAAGGVKTEAQVKPCSRK
jgi:hypothetical protein